MKPQEYQATVLEAIQEIWAENPQLRLGQLLVWAAGKNGQDLFYMPDDELIMALYEQRKEPNERLDTDSR